MTRALTILQRKPKPSDKVNLVQQADVAALFNQGFALHQQRQLAQAESIYKQVLAKNPKHFDALHLSGVIASQAQNYMLAADLIGQAILIDPNNAIAFYNHGLALHKLKRLEEAVASYDQAIAIKPDYAEAYSNLGNALQELKRVDEALVSYGRAIEIKPDAPEVYWNKALTLLLVGKFDLGWELYEWRWEKENSVKGRRSFPQPLWLGNEDITGKTILLHAEQGFGDTIQFCRYASLVKARGAEVVMEVPQALAGLLNGVNGVDKWVVDGDALPAFDYHCPLLSLPLAFKTELSNIPNPGKYLVADASKALAWKTKLVGLTKPKVGVVWNGGFRPNQPELWAVNERRNIALQIFADGLKEVDAHFISLQKGDPAESEIKGLEQKYWPRGNFLNFADDLKDFTDTAALIENLDLVISVDTATAHLAAAMGKPTWILNRYDACWRWLLDREDSPWYETVKLYRQNESKTWDAVLERVAEAVNQLAKGI